MQAEQEKKKKKAVKFYHFKRPPATYCRYSFWTDESKLILYSKNKVIISQIR